MNSLNLKSEESDKEKQHGGQVSQQSYPEKFSFRKTRPDTRLPQSRASGQGPQLRSPDHLGRSSEAKNHKNPKKVKCDQWTDGPTKRGVESRSTRLKKTEDVSIDVNRFK